MRCVMLHLIQEFKTFPLNAKMYILYHCVLSPALIVSHMLPIYLLYTGYNVLEIGILYTIVNFVSIVSTYLIGRLLDKIAANHALTLDIFLEGLSFLILGFAIGKILPIIVVISCLIQSISSMFTPAYSVYEYESYPKEKREKIYAYHLAMPEITQLIAFPLFGIIWGILYPTPCAYRIGFFIFGFYFLAASIIPIKILPVVRKKVEIEKEDFGFKILISKELKIIMLIEILLIFAWGIIPQIVLINYVIQELHGSLFHITLVEAVISIVIIITGGFIKDIGKTHTFTMLIGATFIMILYTGLMSFAKNFPIVLIAYGLMAFGDTLWHPYHQSMLFYYIPEHKRGEFFGAFTALKRTLGIIFPFLAGFIAHKIHPLANYGISFLIFFLVILLYLYLKQLKSYIKEEN